MSDLQCPARLLFVRERPTGGPLAERLRDERVAATYAGPVEIDDLADRHRGEAVLVVGQHELGSAPLVLVEVDADGRRTSAWDPGHD